MSLAVEDPPAPPADAGVVREARGRQNRRRRRVLAAAVLGVALGGAAAGGIAGSSGSGRSVRAGKESFETFAARRHLSAEGVCRSLLPAAGEFAPGGPRRRFRDPKLSYAFWRTILVTGTGPGTMIMFESADRRATRDCFVGREPRSATMGGSYAVGPPAWPLPALAPSSVSEPMSGGARTLPSEGSEQFSWIAARVGVRVRGVTVRFLDGGHVAARIANGWYFAWWRGRRPLAKTDAIIAG
jgi:hypothetical protein